MRPSTPATEVVHDDDVGLARYTLLARVGTEPCLWSSTDNANGHALALKITVGSRTDFHEAYTIYNTLMAIADARQTPGILVPLRYITERWSAVPAHMRAQLAQCVPGGMRVRDLTCQTVVFPLIDGIDGHRGAVIWAADRPPARDALIVELALHLCHALHVLHTAGVYHMDIKPANVMFDRAALLDRPLAYGLRGNGDFLLDAERSTMRRTGLPLLIDFDNSVRGRDAQWLHDLDPVRWPVDATLAHIEALIVRYGFQDIRATLQYTVDLHTTRYNTAPDLAAQYLAGHAPVLLTPSMDTYALGVSLLEIAFPTVFSATHAYPLGGLVNHVYNSFYYNAARARAGEPLDLDERAFAGVAFNDISTPSAVRLYQTAAVATAVYIMGVDHTRATDRGDILGDVMNTPLVNATDMQRVSADTEDGQRMLSNMNMLRAHNNMYLLREVAARTPYRDVNTGLFGVLAEHLAPETADMLRAALSFNTLLRPTPLQLIHHVMYRPALLALSAAAPARAFMTLNAAMYPRICAALSAL